MNVYPCCFAPMGKAHKMDCSVGRAQRLTVPVAKLPDGRFRADLPGVEPSVPVAPPQLRYAAVPRHGFAKPSRLESPRAVIKEVEVVTLAEGRVGLADAFRDAKRLAGWLREIPDDAPSAKGAV